MAAARGAEAAGYRPGPSRPGGQCQEVPSSGANAALEVWGGGPQIPLGPSCGLGLLGCARKWREGVGGYSGEAKTLLALAQQGPVAHTAGPALHRGEAALQAAGEGSQWPGPFSPRLGKASAEPRYPQLLGSEASGVASCLQRCMHVGEGPPPPLDSLGQGLGRNGG